MRGLRNARLHRGVPLSGDASRMHALRIPFRAGRRPPTCPTNVLASRGRRGSSAGASDVVLLWRVRGSKQDAGIGATLRDELFPAEQARIVRLLMEQVEVGPAGADIRLRVAGLASLVRDLGVIGPDALRAAA